MRPSGCSATDRLRAVSSIVSGAVSDVRTRPGATAFTRMARLAYDAAADRTSPRTPALAAAMASWFAIPSRAAADDNRTTEPPLRVIARMAARTVRNAEVRLLA